MKRFSLPKLQPILLAGLVWVSQSFCTYGEVDNFVNNVIAGRQVQFAQSYTPQCWNRSTGKVDTDLHQLFSVWFQVTTDERETRTLQNGYILD